MLLAQKTLETLAKQTLLGTAKYPVVGNLRETVPLSLYPFVNTFNGGRAFLSPQP